MSNADKFEGTDVTLTQMMEALKIAEARLLEAERALAQRDKTLSAVAHDLRSPLNVILMSISVPEPNEETRLVLKRSAERMARMIDGLRAPKPAETPWPASRGTFAPFPRPGAVAPWLLLDEPSKRDT